MGDNTREVTVSTEEMAWYRVVGSKVWYFFNSLKLTLSVLITLASVSIIGTVIEQNLPIERYVETYGVKWTKVILYTGINDMYHSKWFLSLLAALTLNIIVCTLERFPPKWKSLLNHKPQKFDPRVIEKCSHHYSATLQGSLEEAREKVLNVLKRKRFRVAAFPGEGGHGLYAWKGRIGRFGSDFTHISLLLILLGAIVGSFAGFKDFKVANVGESFAVPYEDFSVRLEKFWIDYYDTGQIRQYNSLLTVVEDGKDVLTKQIWVNEPLYYKGVRFYQSNYGVAWNKVEEAHVAVIRKGGTDTLNPVKVKWGETKRLPGRRYSVKLVGYTADFAFDEATSTVFSKTAEANNPAVNVEVYEGGKLVSKPWLFIKYPGIFPAIPSSDDDLVFTGYKGVMYSGLSVNKDPGTNIVWAGTLVMAVGFFLAFFVFYRRVWVHIKDAGRSAEVRLGGIINKNNLALEKELEDIIEEIRGEGERQETRG